ncbi:MAG TPA: LemA family protein [Candidatus Limnocylindrales bacterium]|nr:LemA family protein [Candidatus Limnocylindrales bacterium]
MTAAATLAAVFSLAVLLAIVGFLAFATWNAIVALGQRIDKAWANVDVALQQRNDELPNLVAAVRAVLAFERDTLERVTRARAAYSPAAPIPQQAATSDETTRAVRQLLAVVERYPELRSSANVAALQAEIERLESLIADRRELYNDQVYRYNTRIRQLPAVLLASIVGWRPRPFFAADDSAATLPVVDLAASG